MDRIEHSGITNPPPVSEYPIPTTSSRPNTPASHQQSTNALRPPRPAPSSRLSSIRIRRLSSANSLATTNTHLSDFASRPPAPAPKDDAITGRKRSSSEPQRYNAPAGDNLNRTSTRLSGHMSPIAEASSLSPYGATPQPQFQSLAVPDENAQRPGRLRRASNAATSMLGFGRSNIDPNNPPSRPDVVQDEYGSHVVDLLDVVDPEVSTLTSLTNVQNSLFVPDLGRWVNRRPTYTITRREPTVEEQDTTDTSGSDTEDTTDIENDLEAMRPDISRTETLATIRSTMSESRYAVLPHNMSLDGWSKAEKKELNDHVRHMLHSKRSKFKRSMKGFGQYIRRPLGFFITLYATLITLFGLAWVLFLIGWINVGGRQLYVINVIDNILVALFAIMGDGLAPFRCVDTYHMIFIAHYHYLSWKLRKRKALPKLHDKNDLPSKRPADLENENGEIVVDTDSKKDYDVEAEQTHEGIQNKHEGEFTVLTPLQQHRLEQHQAKFSKSHTFYKPHETVTHHAFPLKLLITIVVLLDFHSIFQIALGTCTWSIDYHVRPFALTTVILCCSITCNITAGVLISVGDRKTRKKDVVERMMRQELTQEAIDKLERRRRKHEKRNAELEAAGKDPEGEEKGGRKSLDLINRITQGSNHGSKKDDKDGKKSFDFVRKSYDFAFSPSSTKSKDDLDVKSPSSSRKSLELKTRMSNKKKGEGEGPISPIYEGT